MKQIALDIGLGAPPSFESFFAGPNEPALRHLQLWAGSPTRSPVPTYLWGAGGSGKSHLLKATGHALRDRGATCGWLDASVAEPPAFDERWAVVLMDDVHLYTAVQQHAAFNWFINAQTMQRGVLAAGALPPADLALREDLRTRLGWGHVFQLQVLSEPERRAVLRQAADDRGVFLSDEVMDFMLTRFSRDLAHLMQLLQQLDGYALQTKRAITIPLIKSMLENEVKKTRIALFDLDHTLIPIDSDFSWGDFTQRIGWTDPVEFKRRNDEFYEHYKVGTLDVHDYVRFATEAVRLKGPEEAAAAHDRFMREVIAPAIHEQARELIEGHRRAGDLIAIVTATNEFVVAPIAREFGVDELIAVRLSRDAAGWITGDIDGVPSLREGKVHRVEEWLAQRGLTWQGAEITFYSDSTNDLPLLERVDHPVATNPDERLRAIARQRGWRILDLFSPQ